MRRPHRAAHRVIWPILALAVAVGLTAAMVLRPPIPVESSGASGGAGR